MMRGFASDLTFSLRSRCVLAVFLPHMLRGGRTYPVKLTNRTKLPPASANW